MERRPKTDSWDDVFAIRADTEVPEGFLSPEERDQGVHDRDPFDGWCKEDCADAGDDDLRSAS